MTFKNTVLAACLVALAPLAAGCTMGGPGSGAQQDVVDRSTLAL